MNRHFQVICLCLVGSLFGTLRADDKEKPEFRLTKQEQAVVDLTNKAREKEKLEPLKANPVLCELARAHSKNMALKRELKHVLDGKDLGKRAEEAGYKFAALGENIAMGDDMTPKEALEGWMKSEGHRANILNGEFEQIGVGIYRNDKGEVYFTQVFGKER